MMILGPMLEELRTAARPTLVVEPPPGSVAAVALLPGSFDPLTMAHVALAEAVSGAVELAVLLYSVRTLPKEGESAPSLLSERDRIAILQDFCRTRERLAVGLCSHGLLADQVEAARRRFPHAALSLVVGSDKVLQLLDPRWYADRDAALRRLFEHAKVLYAIREGDEGRVDARLDRPENRRWKDRFERLDVPPSVAAISSRLVRQRLQAGLDVGAMVPPEASGRLARHASRLRRVRRQGE